MGGLLYFNGGEDTSGEELWKSDGTPDGTVRVKDIRPGTDSSNPSDLTAVGDTLYFQASDGVAGWELWKSDGTTGGTVLVKDINPGTAGSYPRRMAAVGGTLFFQAEDGVNGTQLWRSDGTATGTFALSGPAADLTAPDTTITSGPANGSTITTGTATFAFSGTPGDTAKLQCSLDGAAYADCTSPHTFTPLANGSHTVGFRAIDAVGNIDATPATRTFTVNTNAVAPPVNTFTAPKGGKANKKKATLALKVTLPGPGVLGLKPEGKSPVKTAKVTATKAGPVTITVKLTKAGLKKIKAKSNGKLKVKVALTFTPTGGSPNTQATAYKLTFKKK